MTGRAKQPRRKAGSAAEYEVGRGKPPKHSQFKPGQSGNPRGRPKGTKNFKTDLAEELAELAIVTIGGKPVRLSKQRIILKTLTTKAAKGNMRAIDTVAALQERYFGLDTAEDKNAPPSASDQEILDRFIDAEISIRKAGDSDEP